MSRHLIELQSLLMELRDRYGAHDDSVQQVKSELEAVEATESTLQGLATNAGDEHFSSPRRHSWEGFSSLLH